MQYSRFRRFRLATAVIGCAGVVVSFVTNTASGHHSSQMFDMQRTVTLEGQLTDFDFTNPHAYLTLEITDEGGEVDVWEIETVSAVGLRRRDIGESTFTIGELLIIEANPPRNAERRLASGDIVRKSDGTEVLVGNPRGARDLEAPVPVPAVATSLAGVWRPTAAFGRQIGNRGVLEAWPLTETAREALEQYDGSQNPAANCIPSAPPVLMFTPPLKLVEISETVVTIRAREDIASRTIYVDGRAHPENLEPSHVGHSIGRWEDDVLVVDTIHFTEHLLGNAAGVPSGLGKHLIERFSLSEDGTKIEYSFILEDPEFLTDQVIGNSEWNLSPNLELETYICDPESARRFLEAY